MMMNDYDGDDDDHTQLNQATSRLQVAFFRFQLGEIEVPVRMDGFFMNECDDKIFCR